MLQGALPDFLPIPFLLVKPPAVLRIPFDPVFNSSENKLHENSLRASPTAPPASKHRCEKDDEHEEGDHGKSKQEKILREERNAPDDERAFHHIEEKKRMAVHLNKGAGYQDTEHEVSGNIPPCKNFTCLKFRMHPFPFPFLIHDGEVITEILYMRRSRCFSHSNS